MNIVIIGPPGSGKGTQAKRLAEDYDLLHFSIGRLIRTYAENNPLVDSIVNQKGKYIPTGIAFEIAKNHLEKNAPSFDNILFDGYPRTVNQYELLKDLLKSHRQDIEKAFYLNVPEDDIVKRLSSRRVNKKTGETYNMLFSPPPSSISEKDLMTRDDDDPEAIKKRLIIYKEKTLPLIDEYKKEGILIEIDAAQSIDDVYKEIKKHFDV